MNCLAGCGNQDVPVYKTLDDGVNVQRIRWCQCGAKWRTEESSAKGTLTNAPRPVISDRRRPAVTGGDVGPSATVRGGRRATDPPLVNTENHDSNTASKAIAPRGQEEGGGGLVFPVSSPSSLSVPGSHPDLQKPDRDEGERDEPAVRGVFEHYRVYHPRSFPKPRSASKEWRLIRARLAEGYSATDLHRAIDGYHRSPFHRGENDRGAKYLDLELIVRDGSHVARGIEMSGATLPVLSERQRTTARALENFVARGQAGGGK